MIILGVQLQHFGSQLQLMRRVVQNLHNDTAMVPDLVVLGIVQNYRLDVLQFLLQTGAELLENVPAILPHGVVGRVQAEGVFSQFQGSWGLFALANDRPKVVVDVGDWWRVKKRI